MPWLWCIVDKETLVCVLFICGYLMRCLFRYIGIDRSLLEFVLAVVVIVLLEPDSRSAWHGLTVFILGRIGYGGHVVYILRAPGGH